MTPKQKYILLTILAILSETVSHYQYQTQKDRHLRLQTKGMLASITSNHYTSWGVGYEHYTFTTNNGQKFEETEKSKDSSKYIHALVIYNLKNPSEFELFQDFAYYSPHWMNIFFFLIYPFAMTMVSFGFVRVAVMVYKKLKE